MRISEKVIESIKNGAVGVIPTDTIFGVIASVDYPKSFERIYEAKNRPKNKQMIHLVGSVSQLGQLGIELNDRQNESLKKIWPGPVSVIFKSDNTLPHSHAETFTIAVRIPKDQWLRDMIKKTGPIVATSANLSGQSTPKDIEIIKKQIPNLDFYVDGPVQDEPSKICRMEDDGNLTYLSR